MKTSEYVSVRRSRPGLGLGLFARTPFAAGERVAEYTGRRIPTKRADSLTTRYLLEIDDVWTIDGSPRSNTARYINHSCDPNCEGEVENGRVYIVAHRAIAAGEEFTLDYGDEYFDEFIRPAGCKCERCSATAALEARLCIVSRIRKFR